MARPPAPPRQASPSQQNLAATVTLGVLTLVFLLIPLLAGRSRPSVTQPTAVNQTVAQRPGLGPAVPPAYRPLPTETESAWAPSPEFSGRLQRLSFALLLMTGLIFVTLKAIQKFFPQWLRQPGSRPGVTPLMEVLEKHPVAPGVNLALVRVGDKTMVLGFTEHSVNTVCQLSAEEWQTMCDKQQAEASEQETARTEAQANAPDAGQVYRQIFRQYLSIIPGMGTKR